MVGRIGPWTLPVVTWAQPVGSPWTAHGQQQPAVRRLPGEAQVRKIEQDLADALQFNRATGMPWPPMPTREVQDGREGKLCVRSRMWVKSDRLLGYTVLCCQAVW